MCSVLVTPLSVLVLVLSCSPCLGWHTLMHRDITKKALEGLPPDLGRQLSPYRDTILWNSMVPDLLLHDWPHHEWNVHRQEDDPTDGPAYIGHLARGLIYCLSDGTCSMEQAAETFGLLSHYIADLNQPLHTDEYLEDDLYVHFEYEKDAYGHRDELEFSATGVEFWSDVEERARSSAMAANAYYETILKRYWTGGGFHVLKEITEQCLSRAVQDIVDLWSTIWYAAKAKEPARIALQVGCQGQDQNECIVTVSSVVTVPCLRGDLYLQACSDSGCFYVAPDGAVADGPIPAVNGWKPMNRCHPVKVPFRMEDPYPGQRLVFSAWLAREGADPESYAYHLSNVASVQVEAPGSRLRSPWPEGR